MGMMATPSTRDFHALVRLYMIQDCPITTENIKHADTHFGPDLATIRGKTVRRKPTRVVTVAWSSSSRKEHYPSRVRRPPQHLAQDYLFATVIDEHNQHPEHPYQTGVETVVDLAIKDEYMMAQVCHHVMTHTANSLYCTQDIKPKKETIQS